MTAGGKEVINMPIFRNKTKQDFTLMSNHHLRNQNLSLKARGLLSTMLALPEDWDYTLNGLVEIVKDGLSSVRAAVAELEEAGYVRRVQQKGGDGKFMKTVYNIYETPQNETETTPFDFPTAESPITENPTTEKRTQSNTNISSINKLSIFYNQSIYQSNDKTDEADKTEYIYDSYKEIIKRNIGYEGLTLVGEDVKTIDEIVELMTEMVTLNRMPVKIGGNFIPSEIIKKRFLSLEYSDIEYVMFALSRNITKIKNIKAYLTAALFNSKTTNRSYYNAEVSHDMYG